MSSSSTPPTYVHFGRGGWGNITHTQPSTYRRPSHATDIHPVPSPSRPFSTGIGGHANICKSTAASNTSSLSSTPEDLHSLLSSACAPAVVLSSCPSSHFGVGGCANTYKQEDNDMKTAKANNDKCWRDSLRVLDERRGSAGSGKTNGSSRRASVAESLREFLGGGRRGSKE